MPFFGHVDVLSEARRIYFWDIEGIYFDNISRNATSIFQLFFYKIFSVFIEAEDMLFAHHDMTQSTAHPMEYFEFVSNDSIFRVLFIIKLPFLAADLIAAWALFQYCGRDDGARRAVVFWLFNPITIFAFYIFGRFESIPIMFCMLSLLAIQRKQLILAAVMVGLSINSRELFIFLGPIFIAILCSASAKNYSLISKVVAIGIVLFFTAVSVQLISLTGSSLDSFGRDATSIATEGRVDYLFKFIIGSFLMFPMMYFLSLLYTWNSNVILRIQAPMMFSFIIMSFFILSSHTAHYTSWMLIFPCIYYAQGSHLLKPMIMLCLTWFFYNLSITDLGVFTTWLASPWSIHLAGLPNFPTMYNALGLSGGLDLLTFQRICRTFYKACIVYLLFQMLIIYVRQIRNSNDNN